MSSERLYYVQDTRNVVGNCAMFWAIDGSGYTCDLDKAHVYSEAEIMGIRWRSTDVPRLKSAVDARAPRHCRVDVVNTLDPIEGVRHET